MVIISFKKCLFVIQLNETETAWVINLIFLFLITLVEIFHITEIFFYNKKYTSVEELMYVFIAIILLVSIILSVVGKIYTKKETNLIRAFEISKDVLISHESQNAEKPFVFGTHYNGS